MTWVCDGDTIWVRCAGGEYRKIRLLGIDAPESRQAFGCESQEYLASLLQDKTADIEVIHPDIYGRWVARVRAGGCDVCLAMIEAGMAWPYYAFFRDLKPAERDAYRSAARAAQAERLGLWEEEHPEAPWDWRRRHRSWRSRLLYWIKRLLGLR